jgi:electron transport complex protein RnfG
VRADAQARRALLREALRHTGRGGLLLAVFAVLGGGIVGLTHDLTAERIAENERAALLANLHALVPPGSHDNDIATDTVQVTDPDLLGSADPVTVYRARREGEPVAAVLTPVAPNGYSGPIKLLVAVRHDGILAGVRVLAHRETPGLGDAVELEKSDWILGFEGRSLGDPRAEHWAVKKDGGAFDQFTGATITPRAVVGAVKGTLMYFETHRAELFADGAHAEPDTGDPHER